MLMSVALVVVVYHHRPIIVRSRVLPMAKHRCNGTAGPMWRSTALRPVLLQPFPKCFQCKRVALIQTICLHCTVQVGTVGFDLISATQHLSAHLHP